MIEGLVHAAIVYFLCIMSIHNDMSLAEDGLSGDIWVKYEKYYNIYIII